jgi:hypothetical protein
MNCLLGKNKIPVNNAIHRCHSIKELCRQFADISFSHIYSENNEDVDFLCKKDIGSEEGISQVAEIHGNHYIGVT